MRAPSGHVEAANGLKSAFVDMQDVSALTDHMGKLRIQHIKLIRSLWTDLARAHPCDVGTAGWRCPVFEDKQIVRRAMKAAA